MRVGFIGCVQSSFVALRTLLSMSSEGVDVVAVITKDGSTFNADFVDVAPLCKESGIPFHYEDQQKKDDSVEFMKSHQPDVIFCIGWSYLLNNDFLTMPPLGVIGFHPAKLPQNRGRHPIIWALALGLESTASTFFRMDEGADTGDILSQVDINISGTDDADSLYRKILTVMEEQVIKFTRQLVDGTAEFKVQDHSVANSWRKRSRKDGLIDWRMSAVDIYNLVRALTRPYPGAEFQYQEAVVPVWRSRVCEKSYSRNIEPGSVLVVDGESLLVKCGGNRALWLLELELETMPQVGEYL